MERLHFSRRARRRLRRQRIARWAAGASIAAMLLGIPGATAGLQLLEPLGAPSNSTKGPAAALGLRDQGVVAPLRGWWLRATSATEHRRRSASKTPIPKATRYDLETSISAAATEFGVDGGYLLSIAECESDLDPGAYNAAGYHGLFQFDVQTWAAYGYGSIYDPVAQARTAARLISAGHSSRWPNCA